MINASSVGCGFLCWGKTYGDFRAVEWDVEWCRFVGFYGDFRGVGLDFCEMGFYGERKKKRQKLCKDSEGWKLQTQKHKYILVSQDLPV